MSTDPDKSKAGRHVSPGIVPAYKRKVSEFNFPMGKKPVEEAKPEPAPAPAPEPQKKLKCLKCTRTVPPKRDDFLVEYDRNKRFCSKQCAALYGIISANLKIDAA